METSIALLLVLLLLSAFFSGAEVALVSLSPHKAKAYLQQKRKGAESLSRIKEHPKRLIITILIGNNVVNIYAASLATLIATETFGHTGVGIATGVMTLLVLVFGEITPKTLADTYAGEVSLRIARPIELLMKLFHPIVLFLEWFSEKVHKLFNIEQVGDISESEIKAMIDFGVEQNVLDPEEQSIMVKAISFADTQAKDVMTPIKAVFALKQETKLEDSIKEINKTGFSRIPIYSSSRQHITGVVFIKEILAEVIIQKNTEAPLMSLANEPIFIEKDVPLDDLFNDFQDKHMHMAVVKDGTKVIGIVTLEDLLEELVGEITDETDVRPEESLRLNKNTIVVHGQATIQEVNELLDVKLPINDKIITIGDLIGARMKGIKRGKRVTIKNVSCMIKQARNGKVMKVRLRKLPSKRRVKKS